jgi:hypothetical protein
MVFCSVVAVDMRGYNESDKPSGIENYRSDRIAQDLKELVVALGGCCAHHTCARSTMTYFTYVTGRKILENSSNVTGFLRGNSKLSAKLKLSRKKLNFASKICILEYD